MKGLILSGGKGTRLRPLTYTAAKQLVPVANKPVLFYAIEDLVHSGVTDIGIVISVGDTGDQIRAAVGDGSSFGARIIFIPQEAPLGLAHGVKIAQDFIGDDSFVLYLGDNFLRDGAKSYIDEFREGTANSTILLKAVPNPQSFGVAELENGRLVRLVEKPKVPKSNLAVVGIYLFDHRVFDAVNSISPSARGELEITDAIQKLIDWGLDVQGRIVEDYWIDTGKASDMLEANRLVLETLERRIDGTIDESSDVVGRVVIEKGAQVLNSVIRGPAIIGSGTIISDSFVGPFSAIGPACQIESAEIEHSIVMENCRVRNLSRRIQDSLIGRNVEIGPAERKPRGYTFMLGDFSRILIE